VTDNVVIYIVACLTVWTKDFRAAAGKATKENLGPVYFFSITTTHMLFAFNTAGWQWPL
jgi:hypothetical protein